MTPEPHVPSAPSFELIALFWSDYLQQPLWRFHGPLAVAMLAVFAAGRFRAYADARCLRSSSFDDASRGRAAALVKSLTRDGVGGDLSTADASDLYDRESSSARDNLGRIANLFLLSGVFGTLYGLFGATRQVNPDSELTMTLALAFSAFSSTAVAVLLAGVALVLQTMLSSADARNVRVFAAQWMHVRRRVVPDAVLENGIGDVAALRQQIERVATAMEAVHENVAKVQQEYGQSLERIESTLERPVTTAVAAFGRLDEQISKIEEAAYQRLDAMTSRFDDIRRDFAGLGEIVATCRRLDQAIESTANAATELPRTIAATNTRYLDDLTSMRSQFEDTLGRTTNAIATLEGRMEALSGSLDDIVKRYLERLESAMAQHLQSVTERLANVAKWEPEVHAALERIAPEAVQASESLDLLRAQSSAALLQMRDGLSAIVEQTDALTGSFRAARRRERGRRFAFEAFALVAVAYIAWRVMRYFQVGLE